MKTTNILVTGANGQLGKSLKLISEQYKNFSFHFKSKEQLSILNNEDISEFIVANAIDLLINCAAYTNVEKAEEEKEKAFSINVDGVENLGKVAKAHHIKLIHISTDFVFDGNAGIPYIETAKVNPLNVYGLSKYKGENALLNIQYKNILIIRTSWLFSQFGNNFVKTILKLATQKKKLSVVSNQYGSPTYAVDLAEAILNLIPMWPADIYGIYHFANKGVCSWFEFADEIIKLNGLKCEVNKILDTDFKTKAIRPKYSALNTEKMEKTFQLKIRHWKDGLKDCLKNIEYN